MDDAVIQPVIHARSRPFAKPREKAVVSRESPYCFVVYFVTRWHERRERERWGGTLQLASFGQPT